MNAPTCVRPIRSYSLCSVVLLSFLSLLVGGCSPPSPAPQPKSDTSSASSNPSATTSTVAGGTEAATTQPPDAPASKQAAPFESPLTAEELAEGWIALFDGESLFGWTAATKADWKVEDGAIVVSSGEPGLLCTPVQFADYVLQADFQFAPGTNSGIFLHSPLKPTDPKSDCYELNIAEPEISPFPTGSFVGRLKAEATAAPDQWHHYDVTVQGDRVVVRLNGEQVLDYTDPQPLRRGYIGLQLNKGRVAFRKIKLKPLGLEPLLSGKDLRGWKEPAEQKSRFTVNDAGELEVRGGRGYLESEKLFGDFVLQVEAKTNSPRLNSGVFFRCIPGEDMNGYESQIHNGVKNGDRTQPEDCGTGGIFRRVNARLVAADDLTWFTKTLVADGPRIAVWVNGYPVTAWTDDRAPDPNPRKGLRVEAGSIMLQGHDPTTDLAFRGLRAVELAPRRP